MSRNNGTSWNTKYGRRRVRNEAPTLDEAIAAAQGLSDDIEAQAEIAASLIGLPREEVRPALLKAEPLREFPTASFTFAGSTTGPRAVIVERKPSRRANPGLIERAGRPGSGGAPLGGPRKAIVENLRPRSRLDLTSKT